MQKATESAKMKAIVRTKDGKDSPLLAELPIPKATPNHVIVKVMAAPINPIDEYFVRGLFPMVGDEPYSHICGTEGAGIITEVGEGVPHEAVGKKVAVCSAVGTPVAATNMWAQYARVPYDACVNLGDITKFEEFCSILINPLTLLGLVRIVKEMKLKALVSTAAASTLSKSLLKVCVVEGINFIGVVRKPADVKTLYGLGAKYALDMNSPTFEKELRKACKELNALVAFDAIGGDMPARLVKAMPENSVIQVYGMLSGEAVKLEGLDAKMKKSIRGEMFVVTKDKIMTDPVEKKRALDFIRDDVNAGGHLFKLNVARKFHLDEFKTALEVYKKLATQGKVVFLPNP